MTLDNHDRRRAALFAAYVGFLLLGCANNQWQTQPASPPAAVEQQSSIESLRQQANAKRGDATSAIRYADAVAEHLTAGGSGSPEADVGLAIELLDAAVQHQPLRGAELEYARGNIQFSQHDYDVAVATYETNARTRGHAQSATRVVHYYADAGNRESLESFCNDVFPLVRGGDEKNVFITECVSGMGYAAPAEWRVMSGPALAEYERWRSSQAQADRDERAQKAAAVRAVQDEAAARETAERDKKNCALRCAEKESLCKTNCYNELCRKDCSDAEWACRRQC